MQWAAQATLRFGLDFQAQVGRSLGELRGALLLFYPGAAVHPAELLLSGTGLAREQVGDMAEDPGLGLEECGGSQLCWPCPFSTPSASLSLSPSRSLSRSLSQSRSSPQHLCRPAGWRCLKMVLFPCPQQLAGTRGQRGVPSPVRRSPGQQRDRAGLAGDTAGWVTRTQQGPQRGGI